MNWTRFALSSVALGGGVLQCMCWAAVIRFTRATVDQNSDSTMRAQRPFDMKVDTRAPKGPPIRSLPVLRAHQQRNGGWNFTVKPDHYKLNTNEPRRNLAGTPAAAVTHEWVVT